MTLEPEDEEDTADVGGDPACWLRQVCVACGALTEDRRATTCYRCGAPLPET